MGDGRDSCAGAVELETCVVSFHVVSLHVQTRANQWFGHERWATTYYSTTNMPMAVMEAKVSRYHV